MANMPPSWRPKTLPKRGRNLKKTMLENNAFSASILKGFGHRFGRLFGRFFGHLFIAPYPNKRTSLIARNTTKPQFLLGFKHFEEEAHKAKNDPSKQKSVEKSHVFWDIDFERISEGFWECFGRPKSSIFALFSMFFRYHFSSVVRKAKKSTKMSHKTQNVQRSVEWRKAFGRAKRESSRSPEQSHTPSVRLRRMRRI